MEGELVFPKGMHQTVQFLRYSDFYNEICNKLIPESIHLLLQLDNSILLRDSEDVFGWTNNSVEVLSHADKYTPSQLSSQL